MKIDFFKHVKEQVSKVLSNHKININYSDDDTFNDWLYTTDLNIFKRNELQCIFSYNAMLQTLAFNPSLIDITLNFENY